MATTPPRQARGCEVTDKRLRARTATLVLVILGAGGLVTPGFAQTGNPNDAPVQLEWLSLAPVIRLQNVGWDDNVFHVSEADDPTRDFTATLSPSVDAWLRFPHTKVAARSQVDFVYFKELSDIRSIDTDNNGQLDLLVGRLTPYVGGTWANTRHRWNFEIDAPVRRLDSSWYGGVDVLVSKKTAIGVMARRSNVEYERGALYSGTILADQLDAQGTSYIGRIRYALTPLTTLGFDAGRYENEFTSSPNRNSKGSRITSIFEFKPNALINGRAEIGFVSRRFVDRGRPEFRGVSSRVDLGYTLLGRTRFDVSVQRELAASYRADQRDYLQAGVQLSVTHRLASAWDVLATVGRFTLDYAIGETDAAGSAAERVMMYGSGVGYHIGHTRVGIEVSRQRRESDFSGGREYERTRVTSSFTYVF